MTNIRRSALLPYSRENVYRLVNDVAAYPHYMEGCVGSEILESSAGHMVARLDLARAGIRYSFTTRNILKPFQSIEMQLEEGPFKAFAGVWEFTPLSEAACKVGLQLHFEMARGVAAAALAKLAETMGNNLVDAVCKRARVIYE